MMQTVQTVFDFETAARESFVFPRDEKEVWILGIISVLISNETRHN